MFEISVTFSNILCPKLPILKKTKIFSSEGLFFNSWTQPPKKIPSLICLDMFQFLKLSDTSQSADMLVPNGQESLSLPRSLLKRHLINLLFFPVLVLLSDTTICSWRTLDQCFGSAFVQSGSGFSLKSQYGSGLQILDPDPGSRPCQIYRKNNF